MFLWMFIEGLYLHNVVTVTVFQGRFPHLIYAIAGWGSPVLITVRFSHVFQSEKFICFFKGAWAVVMAIYKSDLKCWYGYSLMPYYWILEGPRLIVILVSLLLFFDLFKMFCFKIRSSTLFSFSTSFEFSW